MTEPRDKSTAQGGSPDFALHTVGWSAFQNLCAHILEDVLDIPVEVFREAQDGGQDAVFTTTKRDVQATVQCKFSSLADRTLKPSDLTQEEDKVRELVKKGAAKTYVFMTNMSASAPTALAIRQRLRNLGVAHSHVFGKEFIVQIIKRSPKLRTLVPRVYGLGDLSLILDERRAEQTKALLGHMLPTLRCYVSTAAHTNAVRSLSKHKVALLTGDPATGKSSIAAVLATMALSSRRKIRCFKVESPQELLNHWNPNEKGDFFWVDDAFGANELREDYIDSWISIMPKLQTAIASGNYFVLTSRRHIFEAAKTKLGTRNLPLLRDGRAVINVGELSDKERSEILYNHIKYGQQPRPWKRALKGLLEQLSKEPLLTPEIARQLGDPAYTSRVHPTADSVHTFTKFNRAFLADTIKELSRANRAALTLIFLHRGKMPVGNPNPNMQRLVIEHYSVDPESLALAMSHLNGSFLVQHKTDLGSEWHFRHPTLADAIATNLSTAEGMRELYLRGVKPDVLVGGVSCIGFKKANGFVLVAPSLEGLLCERLTELPNESTLNRTLFAFLAERASDHLFKEFVTREKGLFKRAAYAYAQTVSAPKISAASRAFQLGVLTGEDRANIAAELLDSLFSNADASFLRRDDLLAILSPRDLLQLRPRIKSELLPALEETIANTAENPDVDLEPEENFTQEMSCLYALEECFCDDEELLADITDLTSTIDDHISTLKKNREDEALAIKDRDSEWARYEETEMCRTTTSKANSPLHSDAKQTENRQPRSIFSDVDE